MQKKITTPFLFFAALVALLISPLSSQANHAYLLDTTGLGDVGELYLVGALQGIVNRDAPRLFVIKGKPDTVYAEYLEKEKGFTFTRFKCLSEAIETFTAMKRADGVTPLIKGLIKYPATYWDTKNRKMVNRYYNYWIAANFAAQEDLLPVSEAELKYQSSMLSGSEFWYNDPKMSGWSEMFVTMHSDSNGLSVTPRAGMKGAHINKVVYLDVDVTPKIEIVVSDVTPEGGWSLGVAMGSTEKTFGVSGGVLSPGLSKVGNVYVADLTQTGPFVPHAGRASLRISPSAPEVTVTVKSFRLLDANGKETTVSLFSPKKDCFTKLAIKRDLADAPPYEQNEESACQWSLANQRSICMPDAFASYAPGAWILMGLDYTVAKKIYHFYQNRSPFRDDKYPNLDKILADFKEPGLVFGWLGDESFSCMKLGHYGARYAGGLPQNFSFWQWVPLKDPGNPVPLPQHRDVAGLENKVYVNFSWASSDYIQFSYNLMDGYWPDPNRGKVPVTWGFNPLLYRYAPAFVEYYAHTATPADSFWGFTAGYTHPSGFSPALLKKYAEETTHGIQALGMSPAVDVWDVLETFNLTYEALGEHTPTSDGVKLMSILPGDGASETYWLDNGCPVVRLDRGLYSVQGKNGKSSPESIVAAIKAAAAKNPEKGPQFLTCNCRFSPTFLKAVKEQLPENIVIVGMPDFVALAQEAGAVTAIPYSSAVGSGDSLKVSFELHNASGTTAGPGKVTWTLPPGWKSSPDAWVHESVPKEGNLKKIVTLIPPAGMTFGTAVIGYKDSRFSWDKELSVTTYPQGITVSDCTSTQGWSVKDGAAVCLERGMIKITPKTALSRHDYWDGTKIQNNGRVTFSMKQIDFSRKPILKISIPDQVSTVTKIGITDETGQYKACPSSGSGKTYSIDLSAVTKWTGTKDVTLCIDPATSNGKYVRIRSIKIYYP